VTHQKGKVFKRPKSITYIDGPFFAEEGLDRKSRQVALYKAVRECMENRAKESTYEYIKYVKIEENPS